jgi:hypothetical protein
MEEIADWLEKLGMSEYTQSFTEHRIDVSTVFQGPSGLRLSRLLPAAFICGPLCCKIDREFGSRLRSIRTRRL